MQYLQDYPVVQSVVVLLALTFGLIMLAVDLGFAFADPELRLSMKGRKTEALSALEPEKDGIQKLWMKYVGQEEDYLVEWNKFQEQRMRKKNWTGLWLMLVGKDSSKALKIQSRSKNRRPGL